MSTPRPPRVNLPNLLTGTRLLLAPVLVALALHGKSQAFLLILGFVLITDFLDGLTARLLDQRTAFGARLDSVADTVTGLTVAGCASFLWPEIFQREKVWLIVAVTAVLLPGIYELIRFRQLPGYHTWSAKAATACIGISVLLLFMEVAVWPFHAAVLILVWAGFEEMLMTFWLPAPRQNLPTAWHAWRIRGQSDPGTADGQDGNPP